MDVSYQLSVNFPSESSTLPSPGIELTLFFGMSLDLTNAFIHCTTCPQYLVSLTFQPSEEGRSVQRPKRCDKDGDKDEDNSPKNSIAITNNAIKHQSFVYTLLKDQTILFQTIQFRMSTMLNCSKYCSIA